MGWRNRPIRVIHFAALREVLLMRATPRVFSCQVATASDIMSRSYPVQGSDQTPQECFTINWTTLCIAGRSAIGVGNAGGVGVLSKSKSESRKKTPYAVRPWEA